MKAELKVFKYIEELDCFVVTDEYKEIADYLGLTEWNPVVWIGRLFILDNDYGEHWFDNWDLRKQKESEAQALGIDDIDLMIINPDRFKNDKDGPCHSPEIRKKFWTDVLKSLELSYDLLFDEARLVEKEKRELIERAEDSNDRNLKSLTEALSPIENLEERIKKLKSKIMFET